MFYFTCSIQATWSLLQALSDSGRMCRLNIVSYARKAAGLKTLFSTKRTKALFPSERQLSSDAN
ncbi:hypothetical protein E2C01_092149 [Portunus trituberculatus]|uniref:Uncharacterized protein n=1 Tax=Portunus trituberculatus TaxID=210409 RepID=A0A5B7JJC8_PORTR|nr:hypothetical protein [Portunus trituberculatus]